MNKKLYNAMNWREIEGILYGDLAHPETILGAHTSGRKTIVQAYVPGAEKVELLTGGSTVLMEEMDSSFFAAFLEAKGKPYDFRIFLKGGKSFEVPDPYSFGPQLSDRFIKEFNEGTCLDAYRHLGAHPHTGKHSDGREVKGTLFAVWAPGADAVKLNVAGLSFLMIRHDEGGIFELFVPMELSGEQYCYQIRKGAKLMSRIDPFAFGTGGGQSLVCELPSAGKKTEYVQKKELLIRRVDLSRKKDLIKVARITKELGFTHLSVYFSTEGSMFSPDAGFPSIMEYHALSEECHRLGLGILYDWRIDGFAASRAQFPRFDGTALFEHEDPRRGYRSYDDRFLYQYQSVQVRNYLLSGAFFLIRELGADGILVPDLGAVLYLDYHKSPGEWLPNFMGENVDRDAISLIQSFNALAMKESPKLLRMSSVGAIWKECTGKPEGECLGFEFSSNEDYARDFPEFLYGSDSERRMNFGKVLSGPYYAFVEPRFLMIPPAEGEKLRLAASYSMMIPGKKLFCLDRISEEDGIFLKELFAFYGSERFLSENDDKEESLKFINHVASNELTLSFLRKGTRKKEKLFVLVNLSSAGKRTAFGVADPGHYELIYSSDGEEERSITSVKVPRDDEENSVETEIGASALQVYRYKPFTQAEERRFKLDALNRKLEELLGRQEELRRDRDAFLMEQKRILKRKDEILKGLEEEIGKLREEAKSLGGK